MKIFIFGIFVAFACMAYCEELDQDTDAVEIVISDNDDSCLKACRSSELSAYVYVRNNGCRCYKYESPDKKFRYRSYNTIPEDLEATACDYLRCQNACRAYGCIGGSCLGSNCNCYGCRRQKPVPEFDSKEAVQKLADCSPAICQQDCIRIGGHGGMCIAGHCVCT